MLFILAKEENTESVETPDDESQTENNEEGSIRDQKKGLFKLKIIDWA